MASLLTPGSLALLVLSVSTPGRAALFYVNDAVIIGDVAFPSCVVSAPGADAPACGTCAQPCRSLQFAYDNLPLAPGDSLFVNTGTYTGPAGGFVLDADDNAKAGTPVAPLSFIGPEGPDGRAATDGSGVPLALLDGLGQSLAGVRIRVTGIRLHALSIANMSTQTCTATAQVCSSGVRIMNSVQLSSFELSGLNIYGINAVDGDAIDIEQPDFDCTRCVIDNNFIHDSPGAAEAIYIEGVRNLDITRNEIVRWAGDFRVPAIGLMSSQQVRVSGNVVRDCGGPALHVGVCAYDYSCTGSETDFIIVTHNTFRENMTLGRRFALDTEVRFRSGTGHVFRNNIVHAHATEALHVASDAVEVDFDWNGLFVTGGAGLGTVGSTTLPTLSDWQATGRDVSSLLADPLFVSEADSHLQSPAGHFDATGAFIAGLGLSPFVDRADPAADFSAERPPHGGRADLGAYGDTSQSALTPVTLSLVSGDGQTGITGLPLAGLLAVKAVYATTGGAAIGLPVVFAPGEGGGSVLPSVTQTDGQGEASAQAVLGAIGLNSFQAFVQAMDPAPVVAFTATAQQSPGEPMPDGSGLVPVAEQPEAPGESSEVSLLLRCGCAAPGQMLFSLAALLSLAQASRRKRVTNARR